MFADSHRMSQALDRYLTTPPDLDDGDDDDLADDFGGIVLVDPDDTPTPDELAYDAEQRAEHCSADYPTPDAPPTDEELAQEAAYYAALEQAYNMRDVLRTEAKITGKYGQRIAKMTITEGAFNLIDHLLAKIERGELVEAPAAPAPSYAQPGLLADEDGGPLFSMAEN